MPDMGDFFRFYRAQGAVDPNLAEMGEDLAGRYWTPELESAYNYMHEQPGRQIFQLDVPHSELAKRGINPQYETVLPPDLIDRAQPYRPGGAMPARQSGYADAARRFLARPGLLSPNVEAQLVEQMMNYERLYPELMERMNPMEIGRGFPNMTEMSSPGGSVWSAQDMDWGLPADDLLPVRDFTVSMDEGLLESIGERPGAGGRGEVGHRLADKIEPPMRMRMAEHARRVAGQGNAARYFSDLGEQFVPPETAGWHAVPGRSTTVNDFSWEASRLGDPRAEQWLAEFLEEHGPDHPRAKQIKGLRRGLNEMKAQGFRGAGRLGPVSSMGALPMLLAGPQLGLPEPVTRVAAGGMMGAPLGLPGVLGGAALGGLSAALPRDNLLNQAIRTVF